MKGKWLLDRRHGQAFANLNDVLGRPSDKKS